MVRVVFDGPREADFIQPLPPLRGEFVIPGHFALARRPDAEPAVQAILGRDPAMAVLLFEFQKAGELVLPPLDAANKRSRIAG